MWCSGEFSAIRSSLIAALNIRSPFCRMTQCVCCCCWTGWCCYWSDKSRSDSGWCLPWFSLGWWVDMMQREACSVRGPYCLPLSICLFGSPCTMMFSCLSQCFVFFFLPVSVSTRALIISQAAFFFFVSPSLVLSVLPLPPSLHGPVNGVSVIKSSGLFCWCICACPLPCCV